MMSGGSRIVRDKICGLILVRELDERSELGDLTAEHLSDARRGKNTQPPRADQFRQSALGEARGTTGSPLADEKSTTKGGSAGIVSERSA
jgi:hypothetical protein